MLPGQLDMIDLIEARRLRDEGMRQAAEHSPNFQEAAYRAIERVARRQIEVHIDHVLREDVPTPPHPNCWGPVWMRAIRDGVIQRTTETRVCKTDSGKHAHRYAIYWSLIYDPRSAP